MWVRIYARVSSDQNEGRSVQDQVAECRAWCKARGLEVAEVYIDNDIGASRWSGKDRPAWAKLKEDLRQGEMLVVWEASRGYRDLEEFVVIRNLCVEKGATLAYSGRVLNFAESDDRFIGGLDALLAERESEKIRERVLRGQRSSVADGRPHTRPPWGYRLVSRGEWEFDPGEAPRVKESIERLLDGESQWSVHKWLTENPGKWTPANPTNLQRTLANPAYAGLRVHRGEVTGKGTWKPLITEEQHYILTQRMARMKKAYGWFHTPGQEPKYLLSGIAICDTCKLPLKHTRMGRTKADYYHCGKYGHCCRKAEPMDRAVERELFDRMAEVDPAEFDTGDPQIAEAFREMGEIEDRLEEWIAAAEAGEVTPAAFSKIEKGLRGRIEALKPRTVGKPTKKRLPVKDLEANWSKLSMREKRGYVRTLFTVTVVPARTPGRRDGRLIIEEI